MSKRLNQRMARDIANVIVSRCVGHSAGSAVSASPGAAWPAARGRGLGRAAWRRIGLFAHAVEEYGLGGSRHALHLIPVRRRNISRSHVVNKVPDATAGTSPAF